MSLTKRVDKMLKEICKRLSFIFDIIMIIVVYIIGTLVLGLIYIFKRGKIGD